MGSAHYLVNFSQSFRISHADWSNCGQDPVYFMFTRSKVKVTRVTFVKVCFSVDQIVSVHYLGCFLVQAMLPEGFPFH